MQQKDLGQPSTQHSKYLQISPFLLALGYVLFHYFVMVNIITLQKSVRVLGGTMRLAIPPLYLFPDVLNDIEIFGIEFEYDQDQVVMV